MGASSRPVCRIVLIGGIVAVALGLSSSTILQLAGRHPLLVGCLRMHGTGFAPGFGVEPKAAFAAGAASRHRLERLDGAINAQHKAIMLRMGGLMAVNGPDRSRAARGKCLLNRIVTGMV